MILSILDYRFQYLIFKKRLLFELKEIYVYGNDAEISKLDYVLKLILVSFGLFI